MNRKPNHSWFYKTIELIGVLIDALLSFLWRSALIVANLILLGGTITISAAHSLELMRYAGMSGGLEWIGMVVFELLFIFSSILLDKDFQQKNWWTLWTLEYWKTGWAPWIGFLMGLVFVGFSNYMGMAHNKVGQTIGLAMPAMLLVSKGLLMHQAVQRAEDKKKASRSIMENHSKMENPSNVENVSNAKNISSMENVSNMENVSENVSNMENISSTKNVSSMENVSNVENAAEAKNLSKLENHSDEMEDTKTENNSNNKNANAFDTFSNTENRSNVEKHSNAEKLSNVEKHSKLEIINQTETFSNVESNDQEEKVEISNMETPDISNMETSSKLETPQDWALYLYQKDGELPGRKRLMEVAGCSEWQARKTLQELKKRLGLKKRLA